MSTKKKFKHLIQLDSADCGPTCLRMVAKHYGKNFNAQTILNLTEIGKDGVNLLGIAQAAEAIGFKAIGVKVDFDRLAKEAPLPCIVHWGQEHFVVVYDIKTESNAWLSQIWGGKSSKPLLPKELSLNVNERKKTTAKAYIADPALGLIEYTQAEFESKWASTVVDGERVGVALLLEPTQRFFEEEDAPPPPEGGASRTVGLPFHYFWKYKGLFIQLCLGLLVGSMLQLLLPFLTQSVVDTGIATRNLGFVTLILIAQFVLFVGRISVEFIRSWILMHISTRINLAIISDFLAKLLRLPIAFFDSKLTGDIMQRIGDHDRIEQFLTGSSLNMLFSLFNLVVFSAVLGYYNLTIFGVFVLASLLYTAWVVLFLGFRRKLDHKRFALASQNQSSMIQLITGIQEIKLNNAEHLKRWAWENLQVKQFKLSMKGLAVGQYQQAGAMFINESKNMFISFLAATAVINGSMTLGGMMALQYIIGQLNAPVDQFVQFIQHWQDAKISLERLNEIHTLEDEESPTASPQTATAARPVGGFNPAFNVHFGQNQGSSFRTASNDYEAPPSGAGGAIVIKNLSFTYAGAGNEPVLRNINLTIPQGKVTAIVGSSGSGKTTLLKLLLRFYEPQKSEIQVDDNAPLSLVGKGQGIGVKTWREKCGTVLQDGFIFSDSIANNIAIGDETPDWNKLYNAVRVANIEEFIYSLPLGMNTKIGMEGNGISGGQKQRILIARAVYKNPEYLFFDEATSSLDSNNERVIMENLAQFFQGRTVVIVAHRLSTVKNADQIVVLEKGEVAEVGTHQELTKKQGKYYELVKNQLELGS